MKTKLLAVFSFVLFVASSVLLCYGSPLRFLPLSGVKGQSRLLDCYSHYQPRTSCITNPYPTVVDVRSAKGLLVRSIRTDSRGRFRVQLRPGAYILIPRLKRRDGIHSDTTHPVRIVVAQSTLTRVTLTSYSPRFFSEYASGQILITFRDNVSEDDAQRLIESYGLVWLSHFSREFSCWVGVLAGTPADYIASLKSSEIVAWADQRGWVNDPTVPHLLVQFNTRATQQTARQLIASFPDLRLDAINVGPK